MPEGTPSRWAVRLGECQDEAKRLVMENQKLRALIDKAWRQLDTGDAYGADATRVMLMLQEAVK